MKQRHSKTSTKKDIVIAKGFRISVKSWENDLDHVNTETIEGLDKDECQFYVDVCLLFQNDPDNTISNLYEPSDEECNHVVNSIVEIAKKNKLEKFNGYPVDDVFEDDNEDARSDFAFEVLNKLGLSGGDFYTRVCDEFTVMEVKEKIVMKDITANFIKGK